MNNSKGEEMLSVSSAMRNLVLLVSCCVLPVALLLTLTPEVSLAEEIVAKSQCVTCHTNLRKVIRLSWEIEKIRPKPDKSAETSGEG